VVIMAADHAHEQNEQQESTKVGTTLLVRPHQGIPFLLELTSP
jgi:hypothetical protein